MYIFSTIASHKNKSKNMSQNNHFLSQTLDVVYKNLKLATIAVLVNIVILSLVLYGSLNNYNLEIWLVYALLISFARLLLQREYTKKKESLSLKQWENLFVIGVVLGGLIWAFVPLMLMDGLDVLHQAMLFFVIAGMSAGSIASLSSHYKSVSLFLVITLAPLALKLVSFNEEIYYYMALLVFLFLLMLLKIAKTFHQNQIGYIDSQRELKISNSHLKSLIENAPVGILSYDTNLVILEVNSEFSNILEAPLSYLIGLDINTIPDKRILPAFQVSLENMNGFYEGEYVTKLKSLQKWIRIHTTSTRDEEGIITGGLGIILDITDRIKIEKQFEYQAKYDALTNIPNRYTLMDRLKQEIIRFQRYEIIFAVIFIDLDHFKNINDSFGHSVGDALIIEVARRLSESVRDADVVARLGGDEFVLLLPDLSKDEKEAAMKAEMIIHKITRELEVPFLIQSHSFDVTASMGIALSQKKDLSPDDILKHADMAMYKAKKDGRNLNRFYENSMDIYIQQRVQIENDLKNALKHNEFELYFQPIVDVKSSKIVAAEALLRWTKDVSISPEIFIPIAEECGLILPIGAWVVENAIMEFKKWQNLGMGIEKIAINISIKQFIEPYFVESMKQLINKYEMNPRAIELELTESVFIKDFELSKAKMNNLRDLGVHLSIDDFGTGYSSLSYLKHLPFSTLKIDKSFTGDILIDEDDKKLVSTMIMIAKNLDLNIVAEGVEEFAQLNYLGENKADYYQGYFCSKPLKSSAFIDFFATYNAKNWA